MAWNAIIRQTDGVLVSLATVVPQILPPGLEAVVLSRDINWSIERWDAATRTIVAKPSPPSPIDRINDFMARATFLDGRLTVAQRTQFRSIMATFLGTQRFRDTADEVNL